MSAQTKMSFCILSIREVISNVLHWMAGVFGTEQ